MTRYPEIEPYASGMLDVGDGQRLYWETGVSTDIHWLYHEAVMSLEEGQLLRDAHRLAEIPGVLVHGRLDLGGPPDTARQLADAWPGAELYLVRTGHGGGKDMTTCIVDATNRFATRA